MTILKKNSVSDAVIRRLPRYLHKLTELYERGIENASSNFLMEELNISATGIRQDFCNFGEFGQRGCGYNITKMRARIGHILGIDEERHLIIIGVDDLGHALLQNFPFEQNGFRLEAAFDISQSVVGTSVHGITVKPMTELERYAQHHEIDVAVLTTPQVATQDIVTKLIELGVRAFWNFTNVEVPSVDSDVLLENINFADSILHLKYRILND